MDAKLQECPAVQLRNLWTASKYPKLAVWSEQISLFLTNLFSPEFPYEQFKTEALTSAPTLYLAPPHLIVTFPGTEQAL